jgi:hypothetical protein
MSKFDPIRDLAGSEPRDSFGSDRVMRCSQLNDRNGVQKLIRSNACFAFDRIQEALRDLIAKL